ncbi:MAG: T9SS type A sorting domain-containing protein [Lishizhenia sp.]
MEILKSVVIFSILALSLNGKSQITFHKLFSGNSYDYGFGLAQTEDSSYLIAGASSSFQNAPSQGLLMKTDSLGNFKWSKIFGGTGSEEFRRVKYIENYCIYLAGFSTSQSNGVFDNYVIKTDVNGLPLWEITFGGSNWDRIVDMTILPDSSIFLVGSTFSFGNGGEDWGLYRYDKDGNEIWSSYFGSSYDDQVRSCAYYQGVLYAGGAMFNSDSLLQKGTLLQLDLNGNLIWSTELEVENNTIIEDFVVGNDSKIRGTGSAFTQYDVLSEVLFFRIDDTGNIEANYNEDKNGELHGVSMVSSLDSNYIYNLHTGRNTANSGLFEDGFYDSFIVGFNSSFGYDNFAFNFSKTKDDFVYDMIMSKDGGAVLVGQQSFFDESEAQLCLIKIGPNRETTLPDNSFLDNIVTLAEENSNSIKIYPNPTRGELFIASLPENAKLHLLDMHGKLVKAHYYENKLDLTDVPKGVYLLQIRINTQTEIVRLVKQ